MLIQWIVVGSLAAIIALVALLAVFVWRDLIEPLRLRLVESQDLITQQEKLASLGVLAAGVAHEIRNPLTAIKARLYTQQKSLPPGSPASEHAAIISNEINRLEQIVRGFLDFARPADPNPEPLEGQAFLAEVRDLLSPGWEKDGVEIRVEPGPSVPFEADRAQLKQVLINLLRNAVEAAGPKSTVILRAKPGFARLRGISTAVVVLEVVDQGHGIPTEARDRLFDPFFTTKDDGTGLGLSIAARIVEKHGGALEYQTDPDLGSTFGVVLPRIVKSN
jgi:signal transduction histidine kinase